MVRHCDSNIGSFPLNRERPLYLHVQGQTRELVDSEYFSWKGVFRIRHRRDDDGRHVDMDCVVLSSGAVNRIKEIITNGLVKAVAATTSASSYSHSPAAPAPVYQPHKPPPVSMPPMNHGHKPHYQSGVWLGISPPSSSYCLVL